MKRKVIALLLIAVMLLLALTACGTNTGSTGNDASDASAETAEASDGETLVMCNSNDIGTLSPHSYSGQMYAQDFVYEGLTAFVDDEVVPCLAESWDVSEDGKTYTFHLRKGVKYTDGSDFDADNVIKNFDAILLHREDHSWLESLNQIKDVKKVDDSTVEITLEEAYYPFLQEFTLCRPIRFCADACIPKDLDTYANWDEDQDPIGTGMWILKEHKPGEYAVFERNEDYWGEKPNFKYLRMEVIEDTTTIVSALKNGEIDMIYDINNNLTADAFNELKKAGFKCETSPANSNLNIALNTKSGNTADLAVRQALEYCIDKQTICDTVYDGLRQPCDRIFTETLPYCGNKPNTVYTYDKEKAAKILDDAGWKLADGATVRQKDGKDLTVNFCYISDDAISKSLGEAFQSMCKEVGIDIELIGEESNSFYDRQTSGEFDMIVSETWGTQYDPHSMVASFREPSHADFRAQEGLKEKAELDQLVTDLLVETDEEKRQEMYDEVFNILMDNAVYIPICGTTTLCVAADDIDGIEMYDYASLIPTRTLKRVK